MSEQTVGSVVTFSMFLHKLESLDKSDSFLHRPADREVIDGDLSHSSCWVDDEQPPDTEIQHLDQSSHRNLTQTCVIVQLM